MLGPIFVALCVLLGAAPRAPVPAPAATCTAQRAPARAVLAPARTSPPRVRIPAPSPFVLPAVGSVASREAVRVLAALPSAAPAADLPLPRPRSRAPPRAG